MHYAIGDLHGQLPVLEALLKKIDYKPDEDYLYFLGDYTDWGIQNMETLLYVMDLEKNNDKVFALLGNHDLMMYQCITSLSEMLRTKAHASQWAMNKGDVTLDEFLMLPLAQKDEVEDWLYERPTELFVSVGDKRFWVTHGIPSFVAEERCHVESEMDKIERSVWYRPTSMESFDDIPALEGCRIIRGHSITDSRRVEEWSNGIINIDCGAKVLAVLVFSEQLSPVLRLFPSCLGSFLGSLKHCYLS